MAYGHFGKDIKFKTTTAIGKTHHDTQNRKNKKTQHRIHCIFFNTQSFNPETSPATKCFENYY